MLNMPINKLTKDLFKREENVYWDLTTGLVGIRTANGIFTGLIVTDEQTGETEIEIQQNVFEDFGMNLPAYSQKVELKDVKVGDIVAGESILGFVEAVGDKSLDVRKLNGQLTKGYRPPKVNVSITGGNVRVIRPLFNFGNGGGEFLGSLQNNSMLMMLLLNDKADESSFDKIMPMLLMGGLNGSASPFGGNNNMLQTIMMMKMFSGDEFSKAFKF